MSTVVETGEQRRQKISIPELVRDTIKELVARAVTYCREYALQQSPVTAPSAFIFCISYALLPMYERIKNDEFLRSMLIEMFGLDIATILRTMEEIMTYPTPPIHVTPQLHAIRSAIEHYAAPGVSASVTTVRPLSPEELMSLLGQA